MRPGHEYSVREGTDDDLERIAEIRLQTWSATYVGLMPPEVLRPLLDLRAQVDSLRHGMAEPDALLLVAADSHGTVVGFALSFLARPPDPLLESLHIVGEVQGRGVGTLLMRATAAKMKAHGHGSMHLQVIAGNTRAERFYERLGGIAAGLEPASWAPGVWHRVYRWPDLDVLA